MWFRSVLRGNGVFELDAHFVTAPVFLRSCLSRDAERFRFFAGLVVVEPKKADRWDNRVDKSHN
jgi:hypothetical protein